MSKDTIRFVFMKDPHWDLRGPASRKDNYLEAVLSKFDQVALLCEKIKAEALLLGGDIFLKTDPYRIPYKLVTRMMDYFDSFPVPIMGIIGNHDCAQGLEHYKQYPVSVLIQSGKYRFLDEEPFIVEKFGIKVKVGGVSYHKHAFDRVMNYPKGDEDILVLLAHFFIGRNSGDFFGERIHGIKEFKDANFDILAVGHEHVNNGVYEHAGKHFIDSGQVTRVSASKENRDLVPTVVVFTISKTGEFKYKEVPLVHKSADEVFGAVEEATWKEDVVDWEDFPERLEKFMNYGNLVDLPTLIKQTDFDQEIKEMAVSYVLEEQ